MLYSSGWHAGWVLPSGLSVLQRFSFLPYSVQSMSAEACMHVYVPRGTAHASAVPIWSEAPVIQVPGLNQLGRLQ